MSQNVYATRRASNALLLRLYVIVYVIEKAMILI
jgi:hypothetical protein